MRNEFSEEMRVAEVQGYDGPFCFSELLMQKIWLRGAFDGRCAVTQEGDSVRILGLGKWNRLGGPDFLGARIELGGRKVEGDVELHLHAEDWDAHRHAEDPSYGRVVLHVVLFPPPESYQARDGQGRRLPTLVLLPLLPYDLEAFAWDDAAENLVRHGGRELWREMAGLESDEVKQQTKERSAQRWKAKVRLARLRLDRIGWTEACHTTALEILGYRQNRVPMLMVAGRWPLKSWVNREFDPFVALGDSEYKWSRMGVRPANHPGNRLSQYAEWVAKVPDWPDRLWRLRDELEGCGARGEGTSEFRRQNGLREKRGRWCECLTGISVGGVRWDSIVCDGLLPLLGARGVSAAEQWWWHWYPGEASEDVLKMLAPLGMSGTPSTPSAHGWVQGLLHWWLDMEQSK